MLHDRKGISLVEYLVGAAVAILLLGVAVYNIASKANAEGGSVATWIDGLNVPTSP